MGTDSRRKPGGKQFRLALKGLPWQEPYKSQAPYTRATATPGLPCLGVFAVPQAVPSRVTLAKMNHGRFLASFMGQCRPRIDA